MLYILRQLDKVISSVLVTEIVSQTHRFIPTMPSTLKDRCGIRIVSVSCADRIEFKMIGKRSIRVKLTNVIQGQKKTEDCIVKVVKGAKERGKKVLRLRSPDLQALTPSIIT